jgi:hypothetical protein
MSRLTLTGGLLALCACSANDALPVSTSDTATTSQATSTPTYTLPSTVTGGTGTGTTPTFDCDSVPTGVVDTRELNGPRAYHDIAFTEDGYLVGSDNSTLFKADDSGNIGQWIPGLGMIQQMDWMPNGDLVVAKESDGSIRRITPNGGQTTIATDVGAYGLIVGPDEMLYTASNGLVRRIDPDTGAKETLIDPPGWFGGARVLNFSPDFSKLYMGTSFGNGDVYEVDLDANLTPVGDVRVLATNVGAGNYHDSLGVDICGFLYIADYDTRALYRVSPLGTVQTLLDNTGNAYGHGVEWGSGVGAWREDAIYLPQPYDNETVIEVVIGVPTARSW